MNLTAFFGAAFFSSLFIHCVVVQPAWAMIGWSAFTGIDFVFSIITASRKKNDDNLALDAWKTICDTVNDARQKAEESQATDA